MVEADLSQVEERLMSDSDLYEELLILEDETIDRYVSGEMSQADRASFEEYFLQSPEHRQKLRFARALSKYVDQAVSESTNLETETTGFTAPVAEPYNKPRVYAHARSRRFSWWPFQSQALNYGLASVLIIAIGGLGWIAFKSFRPTGPGRVFEATLVPGGVTREGGEIQSITLPTGTDTLRVRLILPTEHYEDYKVELLSSDSSSVLTREHLTITEASGNKSLFFDVQARALRRDTYRLKLSGRSAGSYEELTSYNFKLSN
jgi:hypothetical protein